MKTLPLTDEMSVVPFPQGSACHCCCRQQGGPGGGVSWRLAFPLINRARARGRALTHTQSTILARMAPQAQAVRLAKALLFTASMALATNASHALAQTPGTVQPGVIEQEFDRPTAPRSQGQSVPGPESPLAPAEAEAIRFVLTEVAFSGNTAIGSEELAALAAPYVGTEVSLATVFALASEVTRLYADRGYALGVAFLPAQEIDGGRIRIEVVEGYIAELSIDGEIASRQDLWSSMKRALTASRPLRTSDLERALLLVDDLPGVTVTSVFEKSGQGRGATRLNVTVRRERLDVSAQIDNRGSEALGPWRAEARLGLNNVLGLEERLSISAVRTIEGNELSYASARLDVPVIQGLTAYVEGSYSDSTPGTFLLSLLEYRGEGITLQAGFDYAVIRTRQENLFLAAEFTYKDLKTDVLGFPFSQDRLSVAELLLDYDKSDSWNGTTQVGFRIAAGLDAFDATRRDDPFRSRFTASGEFVRATLDVARIQSLGDSVSVYAQVSGQYAERPLLASEQCGYGGGVFGRAFDSFEISGDHCIKGAVELRWDFPHFFDELAVRAYGFADAGAVRRRGPLAFGEARTAAAQSAGMGLNVWYGPSLSTGVEVAFPFGRGVALLDGSEDARVFGYLSVRY